MTGNNKVDRIRNILKVNRLQLSLLEAQMKSQTSELRLLTDQQKRDFEAINRASELQAYKKVLNSVLAKRGDYIGNVEQVSVALQKRLTILRRLDRGLNRRYEILSTESEIHEDKRKLQELIDQATHSGRKVGKS